MALTINFLLLAASIIVLFVSGSYFIRSLTKIAAFLRMSEFVVSFILVGLATSLPELFVGINAALANQASLALGNVIGSNIANLTIILALPILFARGITIDRQTLKKDSVYMFIVALLPMVLMAIGSGLSRFDAIILIVVFLVYSIWLIKQGRAFRKPFSDGVKRWEVILSSFIFIVSGFVLYWSANFTVKYATLLSFDLLVPPIFIGLLIVAFGTSLPELVVGFTSVLHKHHEMMLGNIIGSVVINSTLVLGITALITPISNVAMDVYLSSMAFMIGAMVLFMIFVRSGDRITWKEGLILLSLYVVFLIVEFYLRIAS